MGDRIDETTPVSDLDREAIRGGLRAFNRRHMPDDSPKPVELVLREDTGAACGGLLGHIRWHWLVIDTLWVAADRRGRGHGSGLLARAESIGRSRGCRFAALDTAGFQAVEFYLSRGYAQFGELADYPPGSRTHADAVDGRVRSLRSLPRPPLIDKALDE